MKGATATAGSCPSGLPATVTDVRRRDSLGQAMRMRSQDALFADQIGLVPPYSSVVAITPAMSSGFTPRANHLSPMLCICSIAAFRLDDMLRAARAPQAT